MVSSEEFDLLSQAQLNLQCVCRSDEGEVQGMLEELGECRTTNYISKNNNPKSTQIFFTSDVSIYAMFSRQKHHKHWRSYPLTPLSPQGKTSVTCAFWELKCLLKYVKPILVCIYSNLTAAEVIATLLFHDSKLQYSYFSIQLLYVSGILSSYHFLHIM